jgi:hypothetical protein
MPGLCTGMFMCVYHVGFLVHRVLRVHGSGTGVRLRVLLVCMEAALTIVLVHCTSLVDVFVLHYVQCLLCLAVGNCLRALADKCVPSYWLAVGACPCMQLSAVIPLAAVAVGTALCYFHVFCAGYVQRCRSVYDPTATAVCVLAVLSGQTA